MRGIEQFSWTVERVDALKGLVADGLSASQIAAVLGGLTRNAVIGKVHRMGLSLTLSTGRTSQGQTPQRPPRPRRIKRAGFDKRRATELAVEPDGIIELPPDTSPDACTLLELTEESCRWPMGTPGTEEFRFCGSQRGDGPYCARHHRLSRHKPIQITAEERQRRVDQARMNYRRRVGAGA